MPGAENTDPTHERAACETVLRFRQTLGPVVLGALLSAFAAQADAPSAAVPNAAGAVSVPAGLEVQINFWKRIFTVYSTRQVVIHDALHEDRIYAVLDFRPLAEAGLRDAEIDAYAARHVRREKEHVRALLRNLHRLRRSRRDLSPEEQRIRRLFANVKEPAKFLHAAGGDRIRAQRGLRERFAAGVEVSRRYLPEMEEIFRREGLPVELTRLPLVESGFNVHAHSRAGAVGVWQFLAATGRQYMRIDAAIDERRDPIISTRAAARYLKANYAMLGNWPLAVTAYNHGRAGMARAVSVVGTTDLGQIIKRYRSRSFKFASRNFYAEFLAALDVERHFETYFGELHPHPPLRAEQVVVPDYISFKTLARVVGTDPERLATLNPALGRQVVSGRLHVPRGYRARVPLGSSATFTQRYAGLPAGQKHSRQRRLYVRHRVKRGQTLSGIAKRYGTTVRAIQRRNRLRDASRVRAGQTLLIPTG
ncbi:MAG: transglycosylase SLT domain-containing protein [Candidatus Binatia bacterium]